MKRMTSALPTTKESTPLRIESCPSDGPTVRSSISLSGAGSAPLRSTLARSWASVKSKWPSIRPRPPVIGALLSGADSTTPSRVIERARLRPARDQLELEERRAADQLLGALRVLDAGELHHDLVAALRLHGRLRHAELVDAVADDLEGLLLHVVAQALHLARLEG